MKKDSLYLLIHFHEYGVSHAVINCKEFNPTSFANDDEAIALARLAGLDFEPDKDEELDVVELDSDIVTISKKAFSEKTKEIKK